MTAIITDMSTGHTYTAHCEADCAGVDRHAYSMFCKTGQTVVMGGVTVEQADWLFDFSTSADALDEHAADHEQADDDLEAWIVDALAERDWNDQVRSGTRRAGWQD